MQTSKILNAFKSRQARKRDGTFHYEQLLHYRRQQRPCVRRDGVKVSNGKLHVSRLLIKCCTGKLVYFIAADMANDALRCVCICPKYRAVCGT